MPTIGRIYPKDPDPRRLHDFSRRSFYALFRRNGLRPRAHVEQVRWWQFTGLFSRRPDQARRHRSQGVGNAVLHHYRRRPLYLFAHRGSMLRQGLSNHYLTCAFQR
ncbi:hypothetical protein F3I62_08610 [Pseudomonas sp. R-28-1W-6]|uniref:hypothetical protein n=1 Tax=Pseudomonas sp. R-28-1W-6 TaxID=2650101 RepID=UPI0013667838|nr:hypothetical protein [Pseudomonas sp. R-28-1W-6]MWV12151.1 hypothetical protein [Pseudomonas sp. R-28-1W-6]